MSAHWANAALLAATLAAAGCAEDDTALAPYVQTLADVQTDDTGRPAQLLLDNGTERAVCNEAAQLKADTTARAYVLYTEQPDGEAWLASYATILAPQATVYPAEKIVTDPLTLMACWKSGDYVNLHLAMKGTNGNAHYFGFNREETLTNPDGSRTLCVTLLHDQHDDPAYYTRETYLSLPLRPLAATLREGTDSLRLSVNTFTGIARHTFPFQLKQTQAQAEKGQAPSEQGLY